MSVSLLSSSRVAADLPDGWMHVHLGRGVGAIMSARHGGISEGAYAQCNLGDHVGDQPHAVDRNRQVFGSAIKAEPVWLTQVHGHRVVRLSRRAAPASAVDWIDVSQANVQPQADGALTTEPGIACTVMVADCLPILLAAPGKKGVAALHAGWRGLAGAGAMGGVGIVHNGVRALCEATGCDPAALRAWLGPCIGPRQFEVGADVLAGFGADPASPKAHRRFLQAPDAADGPRWMADLPGLAQDVLHQVGVLDIGGGRWCTASDASRFFSFRRDRVTGRQAASICLR